MYGWFHSSFRIIITETKPATLEGLLPLTKRLSFVGIWHGLTFSLVILKYP